jgi:hypothetical protein
MGIDQCHCSAVRKAARRISRMYDAYLEPTGLRNTQYLILAALDALGSAAVNALAERVDVERTAMGKMVGFWGAMVSSRFSRRPGTAAAASSNSPQRERAFTTKPPFFGARRNVSSPG